MNEPVVELSRIYEDLLSVPVMDPQALEYGYPSQGYIVLIGDRAVLVDIVCEYHLPILDQLRQSGKKPALLILSHRHLLTAACAPDHFERELGAPIFLHPLDAERSRVQRRFRDPTDPAASADLAELGLEAILFPGHTAGHILLLWKAHGGVVFVGDSAMSPSVDERRAGRDALIRPPFSFNDDDDLLRRSWESFNLPVAAVLPLHGPGVLDHPDAMPSHPAALRRAEPTPEFGSS